MKQIKRALIYGLSDLHEHLIPRIARQSRNSSTGSQKKHPHLLFSHSPSTANSLRESTLNPIQQTDAGVFITAMQYMVPHFIGSAILLLLSLATPHTA